MQRTQRFGMVLGLVAAALMAFVGCAKKSPLEQMIENRARYTADVNSFYVEETPVVADMGEEMGEGMEGEGDGAEAEVGDPDADMAMEPMVVEQNAHLDLLIKHDAFEKLSGITIDIVQVDANETEKGHWQLWVDTANVERANPTSYSHVIEDVDYVEGDGFAAEVRPVPEAERGDYKEFDGFGG